MNKQKKNKYIDKKEKLQPRLERPPPPPRAISRRPDQGIPRTPERQKSITFYPRKLLFPIGISYFFPPRMRDCLFCLEAWLMLVVEVLERRL